MNNIIKKVANKKKLLISLYQYYSKHGFNESEKTHYSTNDDALYFVIFFYLYLHTFLVVFLILIVCFFIIFTIFDIKK